MQYGPIPEERDELYIDVSNVKDSNLAENEMPKVKIQIFERFRVENINPEYIKGYMIRHKRIIELKYEIL